MATRKIDITETIKHQGAVYEAGETRVVDESLAAYFMGNGWARCSETGETGARTPGVATLQPHDIVQPSSDNAVALV